MASRSKGSTKQSVKSAEKVPAWIQRRASERPAARWIAWDGKRPRADHSADQPADREVCEPKAAPAAAQGGATIIYIAQWKAAHRR